MTVLKALFAAHLVLGTCGVLTQGKSSSGWLELNGGPSSPLIPEDDQVHRYTTEATAPHTASGSGLHKATAGVPASFAIQLVGHSNKTGGSLLPDWKPNSSRRFIYVWISSTNQIFTADVFSDGSANGILTVTYTSNFPGDYLVYIEEVNPSEKGEGLPILGSPFSLNIEGDAATLDVNSLPVCGSQDDAKNDIGDTYWRPGTWLSSYVASAAHGVMRNGWVFQPRSCVFDTFSYKDLMLLASLSEPTWLLILGGSIQRGVFHSLVDMALGQGQKDDFADSILIKCWGYADLHVGNLRFTYQDMRLNTVPSATDSVICNNEKLFSGSSLGLFHSAKEFLRSSIFQDGAQWPSTILSPAFFNMRLQQGQPAIEVLMDAFPPTWGGNLLLVDQMAGFNIKWSEENPTRTALEDVGIGFLNRKTNEEYLKVMDSYQTRDPRVSFMSPFPMQQAKLFENEKTQEGIRKYGGSVHYHYFSRSPSVPEAHNGTVMVHSTITEMMANIMLGRAVGTKAALYGKIAEIVDESVQQFPEVGRSFQLCHDCAKTLLPFHVKPVPDPVCEVIRSLPSSVETGEAWNGEVCPDWCMETSPVSQKETQSGRVDVRKCGLGI
ncbi:unnamed protein product [Ectocarpus sp. 6 AP-2014]